MPEDVDACVESVLEDNPGYSESKAWAICEAQNESGVDVGEAQVEQLDDVQFQADELDEFVSESADWTRQASDRGVAWIDTQTGLTVYEGAGENGALEQQADPMTNGHQLDPETGEGVCESTGESIEAETMQDLTQDCPHCGDPLSVLGTTQQQADGFAIDVLEVVQEGDEGPVEDGALLGLGADMPNAGVYVDWNNDAWPDDEQLADPHVSDYGTVEDLEQATGNEVNVIETIGVGEAGAAGDVDQQEVVISGLSEEACTDIERRYNATVQEVTPDE